MIGCVLVPYFAAAVERREAPSLAGVPLILGESSLEPGKVYAVSGEAARLGVLPGMTLRQAHVLCPQASFLTVDSVRYRRVADHLMEVLERFTPCLEPGGEQATATAYLDLSVYLRPNRRPEGSWEQSEIVEMVRRIGRAVREEVHLSPAIGLAVGKFPAQVAAASLEPNRVLLVSPGREATFLAPLPVDLLPLDEEMARQLRMLGIRTLGQLAALPVSAVMARFGAGARRLHQLARGCDDTPLRPRCPVKTERVSRQFEGPVTDQAILEAAIHAIAAELAYRLQTGGLAGRELWLVLELEDGGIRTGRWVLRRPTNDSGRLARILTELVGQARVDLGITGIQVTLADLVPAVGEQLDLFRPQTGQQHRLRRVLADLVARYGADCFYHISLTDRAASLPERRFRLREVESS